MPPLIPPNGLGAPPMQDDLQGIPGTGLPQDPVMAALAAYGAPNGGPVPTQAGLQPMAGGDQGQGPITDPSQLQPPGSPPPTAYQPTSDAAGAPEVPTGTPAKPLKSGDVAGATAAQERALGEAT